MKNKTLLSDLAIFSFLTLVAYILIRSTISIGFNIDDDHQFISMNNPNQKFGDYGSNFNHFIFLQEQWFIGARFFPILVTIIFLKAKFLGTNFIIHHLIIFFSGVISTFFIYKIFRLKDFSMSTSLIASLVFFTGNEYGEIFWRLICGEGPGVMLYLVGVYFTLKYFKIKSNINFSLSLLFLGLAALTKESFILLFPITFLLPFIGLTSFDAIKQKIISHKKIYLYAVTFFLLIITTIIIMLVNAKQMFDYGSPLSLKDTLLNNLLFVLKWFIPYTPILAIACWIAYQNRMFNYIVHLTLLLVIWITFHLLVYHKVIISFSMGKYIMPGGLVLIALLGIGLEYIRLNSKTLYKISLLLICLILIRNAKITFINANQFAARVNSFNKLIDHTIASNEKNIAIYGGIEFYQSVYSHFTYRGYFPVIYSCKAIPLEKKVKNKYENAAFEASKFEEINAKYPLRTLEQLSKDTLVNTLIVAEPLDIEEVNEKAIVPYFPKKQEIRTTFTNLKFSDLIKVDFWKGDLKNDKSTYVYFTK